MTEMQSRPCINQYAVDDCQQGPSTTYHRPGSAVSSMNFILRSAFLRMTLVATSTIVTVTAFALLAIGLGELLMPDETRQNNTEPMVLAVAGVLLLATSAIQFICVCGWSGWCSLLPRQGFRVLDQNQIYVNGQLVSVQGNTSFVEPSGLKSPSLEPSVMLNSDQLKRPVPCTDQLTPSSASSAMADASTSTRRDLHHLPSRIYAAPIALQEEITPSLRSSFQSFDDI